MYICMYVSTRDARVNENRDELTFHRYITNNVRLHFDNPFASNSIIRSLDQIRRPPAHLFKRHETEHAERTRVGRKCQTKILNLVQKPKPRSLQCVYMPM